MVKTKREIPHSDAKYMEKLRPKHASEIEKFIRSLKLLRIIIY